MCLQELCGRQNQSSDSGTHADSAELASVLPSIQYCKAPKENQSLPSTSTERESLVSSRDILGKLEKVLQSQQTDPSTVPGNSTAKRHLIECTKSGVKLVEMSKSLQCKMKTDLISQDSFDQVSSNCIISNQFTVVLQGHSYMPTCMERCMTGWLSGRGRERMMREFLSARET